MKKVKEVRTDCVDVETVQSYIQKVSEFITSGRDKVMVRRKPNGEMNFIVNGCRVRISSSIMKGGAL